MLPVPYASPRCGCWLCRLRDFRSLFKAGAAPFGASDKGAIYQKRLKTHKACNKPQALRLFSSPHSRF
jgi:hypothetical protein